MHVQNYLIFVLSAIIILFFDKITKYTNFYDYPDKKRKIHNKPVSKLGGIIVFLIGLNIFFYEFLNSEWNLKFFFLLIVTYVSITFLSIIDDYKQVSPNVRLLLNASILFLFFSINIDFSIDNLNFTSLNKSINLNQGNIFFSVLCVLLLSNAINLADGFNGNSISHLIFWYLILYNINIVNNYFHILNLMFLILILIYNLKNKTFIGNNGTASVGFFISVLIINNYHNNLITSVELIFLIFLIPGIDMLRVFLIRIYNNKNPFISDNQHLHHFIIKAFSRKVVLPLYLSISFTPFILTYFLNEKYYSYLLIFYIIIYVIIIHLLKKKIKNV
tara:strand:- start:311 stop:1306 length:996 start_codon:yes stop_codon:yes gene_type:complete